MRWRLAAVLVGFTALVLLMQNVPLASYLRSVEGDRITTGLQRDAFTLAGYAVAPLQQPNPGPDPDLSRRVEAYAALGGARVVVIDSNYVAIASSEGKVGENYANRPEMVAALSGKAVSGERDSSTLGEKLLYVAVPVRAGQQILGAVRLTYPASEVNATVDRRVRSLAIAAAITLLAAALIAWLLASTITRRLRKLGAAAERIAEGDLSARADVGGGGEVQELAESFNTMAERVEQVVESQRGFAGDASHQLRTPLTALRLRLDRAAELMAQDDPATEQVDAARDEIDRLQRLVDGLLTLTRADNKAATTANVDIAAVAAERVESWQPLADETDVRIEFDGTGPMVGVAVPGAVEQIIDNYVDNALEVAPAGSRIVVAVRTESEGIVVTVDDAGPGLSAEDKGRAFDRFWRGRQDQDGSGLGLSIVASLARASGGAVWLDDSPAGGLRACARFRRPTRVRSDRR